MASVKGEARLPARRTPRSVRPALPTPRPGSIASGVGLVAGIAALAAGGIAAGIELEKRVVTRRLTRRLDRDPPLFFSLRSDGPSVTTPDGVLLHTEVDELPGASGTVVFVHGYALSLDCWHFQRLHLRGRARLVLFDQRSHGRSTRSEAGHCRLDQLADDLLQVLDEAAGDAPVVLVGHSMGAMAILRLARRHPELFGDRVRGVALISTSGGEMADYSPIRALPGRTFSRMAQPLMATLNRIPDLVGRARKAGSDLGYVVTRRMSFASEVPMSSVEFVSEMLGGTSLEVVADFYPAFAELDEGDGLGTLSRVPVTVIGGEQDLVTPVRHTEQLLTLMPDADGHVLDPCGHMSMIEHPTTVNEILDAWLATTGVLDPAGDLPAHLPAD